MVHYKITYFDLRGRAEIARQLFALANVEYEDVRVTAEEWGKMKSTSPFGQLPILEVDGQKIAQSVTIFRYLARKFGFAGKCNWESAQIDALGDQYTDYLNELKPFMMVLFGRAQGDKEKLQQEVAEPALIKFFTIITRVLKESKSGFLVGDKVSWVDLAIAEHVLVLEYMMPQALGHFPEIVTHKKKVHSIPELKKWIENRPKTPY